MFAFNKKRGGLPRCIILTGPSCCGKGVIARKLCALFDIPEERILSMGSILRDNIHQASISPAFRQKLDSDHKISSSTLLLEGKTNTDFLKLAAEKQALRLTRFLEKKHQSTLSPEAWKSVTQIEWLEFCVLNGLLVPDRWTESLFEASLDNIISENAPLFILDGYPRTQEAAEHLLKTLDRKRISIEKVVHLIINKNEMVRRGKERGRSDDTDAALSERYDFYVRQVIPCIHYLRTELGTNKVCDINAHQPSYVLKNNRRVIDETASIQNVLKSALDVLCIPAKSPSAPRPSSLPSLAL